MAITSFNVTIDDVVCGFAMAWSIYPFGFMLITAKFHPKRYRETIQELLFYCYITEALSGRLPWIEIKHLVNPEKTSAWRMKKRVKTGSTLKIQSESEARFAGKELFLNVAKPGEEFIELGDLARFLPETDALSLEMSLVLSLKETDSIMNTEDHSLPDCCDCRRSNRWSLILDSTILFFFRHPYAVGEKCIHDGVEMVVKKINFSSITFAGLDMKEYQISSSTLRSKWRIDLFRGSSRLDKMQLILSESQGATNV
ncbi:hypothetical protein Bca101_066183 [Brassica carinata]